MGSQWAHTYQKGVGKRFVPVRFWPCRALKARECRFRGMVVCAQLIRIDIVFCGCHSGPKVRSIGRLSHVKANLRLRCLHVSRGDRVPPLERGADPRAVMTLTFETPRMRTVSDTLLYTKLQHIRSMRNIGDDAGITQSHTTATSRVDWALLRW